MFKIEFEETGCIWTVKIYKDGRMVGTMMINRAEMEIDHIKAALNAFLDATNVT